METPRNPRLKTRFAMCGHCDKTPRIFKVGDKVRTLEGEIVTVIAPWNKEAISLAQMGYVDYTFEDGEKDFSHAEDLTHVEE